MSAFYIEGKVCNTSKYTSKQGGPKAHIPQYTNNFKLS